MLLVIKLTAIIAHSIVAQRARIALTDSLEGDK